MLPHAVSIPTCRHPPTSLYLPSKQTPADSAVAKYNIEEMQRAERKEREARGDSWAPRWFRAAAAGTPAGDVLPGEYSPGALCCTLASVASVTGQQAWHASTSSHRSLPPPRSLQTSARCGSSPGTTSPWRRAPRAARQVRSPLRLSWLAGMGAACRLCCSAKRAAACFVSHHVSPCCAPSLSSCRRGGAGRGLCAVVLPRDSRAAGQGVGAQLSPPLSRAVTCRAPAPAPPTDQPAPVLHPATLPLNTALPCSPRFFSLSLLRSPPLLCARLPVPSCDPLSSSSCTQHAAAATRTRPSHRSEATQGETDEGWASRGWMNARGRHGVPAAAAAAAGGQRLSAGTWPTERPAARASLAACARFLRGGGGKGDGQTGRLELGAAWQQPYGQRAPHTSQARHSKTGPLQQPLEARAPVSGMSLKEGVCHQGRKRWVKAM